MIQIQETLISLSVIEEAFVCDLKSCKGACCVEGDSGAPLLDSELSVLQQDFEKIAPYLRNEGKEAIKEQGIYLKDSDGDWVTPLIGGRECAYTLFKEDGTAFCGIEKAHSEGATKFRKPVSCHLYPVRIKAYRDFEAVNYDKWEICAPACSLGKALKVPVYKFVKEALIRRFGQPWYDELEIVARELSKIDLKD